MSFQTAAEAYSLAMAGPAADGAASLHRCSRCRTWRTRTWFERYQAADPLNLQGHGLRVWATCNRCMWQRSDLAPHEWVDKHCIWLTVDWCPCHWGDWGHHDWQLCPMTDPEATRVRRAANRAPAAAAAAAPVYVPVSSLAAAQEQSRPASPNTDFYSHQQIVAPEAAPSHSYVPAPRNQLNFQQQQQLNRDQQYFQQHEQFIQNQQYIQQQEQFSQNQEYFQQQEQFGQNQHDSESQPSGQGNFAPVAEMHTEFPDSHDTEMSFELAEDYTYYELDPNHTANN